MVAGLSIGMSSRVGGWPFVPGSVHRSGLSNNGENAAS